MSPCDIKTSAKAWNDGLDAFKKAFKQTGGQATQSLKFAIDEMMSKNPELNFEINSFTDPIINSLKEKGIIDKSYSFNKKTSSGISSKKIDKIIEKMKGLSGDQKKTFAKKAFSEFEKNGLLTEENVKNIYSEAIGVPAMDEKLNSQIKTLSQALRQSKEVESEIDFQIKELQKEKDDNNGKLSPEKDKEFSKKFSDLAKKRIESGTLVMREQAVFSERLKEKKFWLHQLTDYMPLNLMNPNSLSKNMSGAVADGIIRSIGNTLAPLISKLTSLITDIHSNPAGAKIKGAVNANIKSKFATAWRYGKTDFATELPKSNYLDFSERWKKAMAATGAEKFKGIISSILKVHPSLISKGLTVPDAIVYEMVHSAEINRIAEAKGLKGAEKKAFILQPDNKSIEIAKKNAANVTFKQDLPEWMSGLKKVAAYNPQEATNKAILKKQQEGVPYSPLAIKIKTGLANIILKSAIPFIKTPINMVRTAAKVLLPEYELGSALMAAKNERDNPIERQRLIIEGITKAATGFFIRNVALQLLSQGLISAGYGDEDKKTKDAVEQELGGPNRINISALIRGLMGRNMKKQIGDKNIDLNAIGAFGLVMGVYAHAFNKYGKDEFAKRTQYNKDIMNAASIPWDLAWSQLSSSMDFTFFTGINQLQAAIQNKEGYEANQLATQYIANVFTGIAPSTYQKLSTQIDPNVKKQFDKDFSFHENLVNVLGYRFAFQSKNLRDKYFSLKEAGHPAVKKKEYMFFDNYLGRALEGEFDFLKMTDNEETPISRLYESMREEPKEERGKLFPAAVADSQTIQKRRVDKNKSYKVELSPEQHDYLQERASTYRMMLATPFIMSKDFTESDFETKGKILQSYYSEGLKMAKKDLKDRFDLSSQKIDAKQIEPKSVKSIINKYK